MEQDQKDQLIQFLNKYCAFLTLAYLVLIVFLIHVPTFSGLLLPDSMKYADVARSIERGQGAFTNEIFPINVGHIHYDKPVGASAIRTPYPKNFMYPLVLSVFFKLFGAKDIVAFAVACLFWILAGWMLYFLGANLFSKAAGVAGTVIYSLQAKMIGYAVAGLAEPVCVFILIGIGLGLASKRRPVSSALLAGVALIAGFYVRKAMFFLCPLTCLAFLFLMRDFPIRRVAGLIAGSVVAFLTITFLHPYLFPAAEPIRANVVKIEAAQPPEPMIKTAPDPHPEINSFLRRFFGITYLNFSENYPGHALERSTGLKAARTLSPLKQVIKRSRQNMSLLLKVILYKLGSPLLGLAFLLAFWKVRKQKPALILGLLVGLLIGSTAVVTMILFVMDRYFQVVVPFMALVVGAAGVDIYKQYSGKIGKKAMAALSLAALAALSFPWVFGHFVTPVLGDSMLVRHYQDQTGERRAVKELLLTKTEPGSIIYSDIPWYTAWHADRTSIWTPLEPAEAQKLAQWIDVKYLFITLNDKQGFRNWRQWLLARREKNKSVPMVNWPLVGGMSIGDGRGIYLFARPDEVP